MGALVALLLWSGYSLEYFGWYYSKGAPVKLTDVVLPSHRNALLSSVSQSAAGLASAITQPGTSSVAGTVAGQVGSTATTLSGTSSTNPTTLGGLDHDATAVETLNPVTGPALWAEAKVKGALQKAFAAAFG